MDQFSNTVRINPSVTLLNWVKVYNAVCTPTPIHKLCTQTCSPPQKTNALLWHLRLAGVPVEMLTHYTNPPCVFMNIVTLRALSASCVRTELKSAVHVPRRICAYVWIESRVKVLFYFLGVGSSFDGPTSEQAWRPVVCRNRLPLSPFLLWLRKQVE